MRIFVTQMDAPPPIPAAVVRGIVAQPGGQSSATPLSARWNIVNTVSVSCGVLLSIILGNTMTVFNRGAGALLAYPPLGTAIEGYGLNVPAEIVAGGVASFTFDGVNTWLVS